LGDKHQTLIWRKSSVAKSKKLNFKTPLLQQIKLEKLKAAKMIKIQNFALNLTPH